MKLKSTAISILIILFITNSSLCFSQLSNTNDNFEITPAFHKNRREEVRKLMPENSVMVVFAAPEHTFSGDVDYPYHQNPDMMYFSGCKIPGSALMIFKEDQKIGENTSTHEILFIPPRDTLEEKWTGKQPDPNEAMKTYGIDAAFTTADFERFVANTANLKFILFDALPEEVKNDPSKPYDLYDMLAVFKKYTGARSGINTGVFSIYNIILGISSDKSAQRYIPRLKSYLANEKSLLDENPLLGKYINSKDSSERSEIISEIKNQRLNTLLYRELTGELREIKTSEELAALKRAIHITCLGQIEAMKKMDPKMSELEIQGLQEYIYRKYGASEVGFPSIIAAGNHACTLHYPNNSADPVGNNLVLMDVGAMYDGYSADVTRTVPSAGKFTPEQLIIYNTVLRAQDSAFRICKAGASFAQIKKASDDVIAGELLKLGIISKYEEFSTYYPHGLSHPIGLDTHDVEINYVFKPGMVFTLEPGIYIPVGSKCDKKWWGIGVRIEDDVLIKENSAEWLSLEAPKLPSEVEKMMKKGK